MEVTSISKTNINFNSKKLYQAEVPAKRSNGVKKAKVEAFITEIGIDDIPKPYTKERKRISDGFGENIIEWIQKIQGEKNKKEKSSFFALEVPNRRGKSKIRAMAMATEIKRKHQMYLDFMQTFNAPNGERQIKGAGSCLLFAIINLARKQQLKLIDLFAVESARDFYKKNGFFLGKYSHFELGEHKYSCLLRKLRKKYSIRSILKNKPNFTL